MFKQKIGFLLVLYLKQTSFIWDQCDSAEWGVKLYPTSLPMIDLHLYYVHLHTSIAVLMWLISEMFGHTMPFKSVSYFSKITLFSFYTILKFHTLGVSFDKQSHNF